MISIFGQGGSGSFVTSNPSVGPVNNTAPNSATELGTIDGSGKLQGVSASNPLPVTGTITATEASIGIRGNTAPLSANLIGVVDGSGNIQAASATYPVRTDPTGTTVQPVSGTVAFSNTTIAVTNTGTFAVQATLAAETTKVIGTIRIQGNVGGVMDTTLGGTKPANVLQVGGNDGTNAYAIPLVSGGGAVVDNVAQWGGTAVSAPPATSTPATGAEVAPVVKNLPRKQQDLLYTTSLLANANYTSAWFDTFGTGATEAFVNYLFAATPNSNSLKFMCSDDQTTISQTYSISPAAGVASTAVCRISARYWRVTYTGNANAQTNPIISVITTTAPMPFTPAAIDSSGNAFGEPATQCLMTPLSAGDGFGSGMGGASNSARLNLQVGNMVSNGASLGSSAWLMQRTPTTFKTAQVTTNEQLTITNVQGSGTVATITFNTAVAPQVGSVVIVSGLTHTGFNGTYIVATSSTTQMTYANVTSLSSTADSGLGQVGTTIWLPTTGKKFRLMRMRLSLTDNVAQSSGGVITSSLYDGATQTAFQFDNFVPTSAIAAPIGNAEDTGWLDFGNGLISGAANNVLTLYLSAALTAGNYRILVCGTEE